MTDTSKKTVKDILAERRAAAANNVPAAAIRIDPKPTPTPPAPAPEAKITSQSLAVDKDQSTTVLLEVGLFIKKHNFSSRALKFAAAYLCAKAPSLFGYDLDGADLEARVEVQIGELVEKYDHLVPIFASWIDFPWVNMVQRQIERYAVRTGYEWMKAFQKRFGRLPDNLDTDFSKIGS